MRVPATQHILLHDRDSAGPAPGGTCQEELGGKLPRRAAWPGITSPFSQMAVLLLCISVEAAVRATSLKPFPGSASSPMALVQPFLVMLLSLWHDDQLLAGRFLS